MRGESGDALEHGVREPVRWSRSDRALAQDQLEEPLLLPASLAELSVLTMTQMKLHCLKAPLLLLLIVRMGVADYALEWLHKIGIR